MQKINKLFAVSAALILAGFSSASLAADKIAVVDMARAIFSSTVAQQRVKEAEGGADFVALKAKYESSAADLQAMAKEAESKRMTWSQEQAAEHAKKMEYAKADAELTMRKLKAESQQLQQRVLQELGPKAGEALREIMKEEGITVLLKAEAVIDVLPESDITGKVANRLNQKTK